jgi:hypothetical protein
MNASENPYYAVDKADVDFGGVATGEKGVIPTDMDLGELNRDSQAGGRRSQRRRRSTRRRRSKRRSTRRHRR